MKKDAPCPCSGNSIVRSQGEFTIYAQRKTFNINADLPYPIWGTIYLNAKNFANPLAPFLPPGITATSTVNANAGAVIITYSNGTATDTIVITGVQTNQVGYLEMLANLNTNYLKTELVYFCCNTGRGAPLLADSQIEILQLQPLYMQKVGGLGERETQTILPLTRSVPNNTVKKIIELSMRRQDIKPETVWIHSFGSVLLTDKTKQLGFYWQIIINDIVNMNSERLSLQDIKQQSQ